MHIKKVRFKNGYKRFHDLTIDLGENPARIIALVGPNGCGKSSVLDGLMFHAHAYSEVGGGRNRDNNYHSMTVDVPVSHQNIELEFDAGDFAEIHNQKAGSNSSQTIFSFRSPYRYNSNLKIGQTTSVSEIKLNNYGAGDASTIDGKMEQNYRRLYAAYNKYRDENDLKPSDAKAKIIGDLNQSISNCLSLKISSLGDVESNRGTLYFEKPDHPNEFEFNVLSSGEKEVVDLLLDLYLRKDAYQDTVFLIDEPELHISTSIQGKLLVEIDRLVGPNCQIWITTHSIGFLRALKSQMANKCQIIQFLPEHNLAAETHTLTPIKAGPGTWRSIFSVALDDLTELVCPSTIIFCEGRAEPSSEKKERGMDAKVFNTVFANSRPEAFFVSSGGNTEPDQRSAIAIAILGKVLPTVEIWVLKDRDMASGKITDQNDRQVYLKTNPQNHRLLKRWEIENYLFDKEVLEAYCSSEQLIFDSNTYDEFVQDIDNQNLKDETGRIKNICGIKGSISPDLFKTQLSEHITEEMLVFKELQDCIFNRL